MTDIPAIIRQLEQQKQAIDRALVALREIGGSSKLRQAATKKSSGEGKAAKRVISASARRRMAQAQKRRWAKLRKAAEHPKEQAGAESVNATAVEKKPARKPFRRAAPKKKR